MSSSSSSSYASSSSSSSSSSSTSSTSSFRVGAAAGSSSDINDDGSSSSVGAPAGGAPAASPAAAGAEPAGAGAPDGERGSSTPEPRAVAALKIEASGGAGAKGPPSPSSPSGLESRYDFHRALAQVSDSTRVIKVGLADGGCKRLRLDESMTAAQLVEAMADKLGLPAASLPLFSIWVRGTEIDLAVELPSDANPADVIENWAHWELEFKGHTSGLEPAVLFLRSEFVSLDTEAAVDDERTRELFFEEGLARIRSSTYVLRKAETLAVLAYAAYAAHGPFRKDVHRKGYFSAKSQNMARFTPAHVAEAKKFKAVKWEKSLLKAWAAVDTTLSPAAARDAALALIAASCPYYGACFYSANGLERNKANKRAKAYGDLVLAVTEHAVFLLPADPSARTKTLVVMDRNTPEFNFRRVNTASDGIVLEFQHKDAKRDEHQTLELATRETALIITHLRHLDTPMLMNVSKFVDELLHLMTSEDYDEGEYIVRTGDPGRCMYFVSAGTIEIEIPPSSPDTPPKTVTLREGSYFGEIALFLSKTGRRTASVRAASPVQLLVLTKETCNSVLHRFPHMEKAFRELGSARLRNNDGSAPSKRRGSASAATPSWMKRISGKVTKRRVDSPSTSASPAIRSKTSQKPRFMDSPAHPVLDLPGAPDPALLPVVDPGAKWAPDHPARVFAPRSDPFATVIEDPVPEVSWFARLFCDQAYSLFMAKIDDAVVLVTILVTTPPGAAPDKARNTKPALLSAPPPLGPLSPAAPPTLMDDDPFDVDAGLRDPATVVPDVLAIPSSPATPTPHAAAGTPRARRRSSSVAVAPEIEASRSSGQVSHCYWVIVWEKRAVSRRLVEAEAELSFAQILGVVNPGLAASAKAFRKAEAVDYAAEQALCTIENGEPDLHFKLGVLYAQDGQIDENDMFGNKDGSLAFNAFMAQIGERVRLKGYAGYCAQLDTKFDKSGLFSYKTAASGYEIMYHVSTELQYDPTDDQYIQRKRFIGNDIVVIVFVDGTTTYSCDTMKSQYTNILLVVQPDPENPARYRIASTRQKGLRRYGPVASAYYRKDDPGLADYLVSKCLNGEHATYVSPEFLVRDRRTRNNLLDDFFNTHFAAAKKSHALTLPGSPPAPLPFAALPLVDSQAFCPALIDTAPCLDDINAVAVARGVLFVGTGDGLYAGRPLRNIPTAPLADELGAFVPFPPSKVHTSTLVRVATLDHIVALKADKGHNALFALTGGPGGRLFEFSLTELTRGLPAVITMIPHSRGVSTFDIGWVHDKFYVCAGSADKVLIYNVRSDGSYREAETLVLPSTVAVVALTQFGVLVGTEEVGATPAQFMFFSLETERSFLYDPVYVADLAASVDASASSSAFAATSTLLSALTDSLFWSGILAPHAPDRMLPSRPVDCLVTPHGVVLCFPLIGVLLAPDGFVEHTIEWNGEAVAFASAGPFFAVYYRTFVEIRTLASGALIETHYARLAGPFACAGDELLFLAAEYADGVVSGTLLYHLEPIVPVDYTSPDLAALIPDDVVPPAADPLDDLDPLDGATDTPVSPDALNSSSVFADDDALADVDVNALASLWENKFESGGSSDPRAPAAASSSTS